MTWIQVFFHRLRRMIFKRRLELDLEEETRSHLEMQIEENVRQGMTQEEARQAASRKFGGVVQVNETYWDRLTLPAVETAFQDLRYGLRMLRRNPGFTLVATLTLALGIGANTAIFSVVNAVLLQSLPYRDPDQLVMVSYYRGNYGGEGTGFAEFLTWRDQAQVFEQIAAYTIGTADLIWSGEPSRLNAGYVTSGLFSTLGVGPALGRTFTPEEDKPGGSSVVILGHNLWQRRFGGDREVLGRTLNLDGQSRTVVGIMPPGFQFPGEIDLWLPIGCIYSEETIRQLGGPVDVIARLKPGVTAETIRADFSIIIERQRQDFAKGPFAKMDPNFYSDVQVRVIRLSERLVIDIRLALLVMFGAVAFVLLIACSNVANLMLARAMARQKEMAIRTAVGAGRLRLVRQLLTESLLLSLSGAVVGLLVAKLGINLLVAINPGGIARMEQSGVDGRVLGFTSATAVLVGLLVGIFPALQASKTDVNEALKAQSARLSPGRIARRSLHALVIAELALTLTLLVGAGLMIKSYLLLLAVPKGFDPGGMLTLVLSPSSAKYPLESPQRRVYFQELLERIQAVPGIQSASLASFLPLTGPTLGMGFQIEGRPPFSQGREPLAMFNLISSDYFQTMRIQMRAGRSFTSQDGAETPQVAIINETMARRHFPNENPIGRRLLPLHATPKTIVGVVGDTRHLGPDREVEPEIYVPYLQDLNGDMRLTVRVASGESNLSGLAAAIRKQAQAQEPNEPINPIVTMEKRLSDSIAPRRFQMLLLAVFAALALVIAAVGIYGVISFAVSQRTQEIGVRMALGARAGDVLWMVVWRGMRLALVGAALGLAGAFGLTRIMKNLLFEVSATDPATFALIALLLVSVAFIASYIPARRATKVDPLIALRNE
jgi:putative ABC transport system permease protein